MREKKAKKLHQEVKKTYDHIAGEFHNSRKHMVNDLNFIKPYLKKGQKIADIGCGNGRFLNLLRENELNEKDYTGIDNSQKLIEIAQNQHPHSNFQEGDFLNLPLENESIDLVVSIRAFHHLTSKKLRLQALEEIKRVLKNDGKAIVTVWNLWHKKNLKILLKAFARSIYTFGAYSPRDTLVPWGQKIKRYYHAFTTYELQKIVDKAGFRIIEVYGISKGEKVTIEKSDDLVIVFDKNNI
jgi:ubiquinone/menaquinone biosynthesis C-methylase UbiE